jgi:hypothetical protein
VLQVICFSKNRPLQLHGYLTSFYRLCSDPARTQVKVLVATQPEWFARAYQQVADEFPQVEWRYQQDFRTDLDALIVDAEYTMFGCDDVVFTHSFNTNDMRALLQDKVLGLSLRLGQHTTRDMYGQLVPQPPFTSEITWSIIGSQVDWGYPWEVLGTVYRTDYVKRMVARIQPPSPSQLEARGALCWQEETDKREMAMWRFSRLVVPTVNLVQEEYPNGICGTVPLEAGFLLECWDHGLRLDTQRYLALAPESWRVPEFYLTRVA